VGESGDSEPEERELDYDEGDEDDSAGILMVLLSSDDLLNLLALSDCSPRVRLGITRS
jgi:hypothetical protein